MIDDSALFHAGVYNPIKAREYYLRTRKLKGRTKVGVGDSSKDRSSQGVGVPAGGKPNRADTKSRQAELRAQKEALNKRLDRLREVLQQLVEAAKSRSGAKKDEKGTAPETQVDKADRNAASKKDKPETTSQKKERATKAKEAYEKEHPNTLSQDVDILREQVKDIQAKIQKAVADARERRTKAGMDQVGFGSQVKNNQNDGPRGR